MRVYSQHQDLTRASGDWAAFHEQIAAAILGDPRAVTVDSRGRLVIVDDSPISDAHDRDEDGFAEVVVVGAGDAGRVVAGDAQSFCNSVRAKIGDWELGARWPTDPVPASAPAPDPEPEVPPTAPETELGKDSPSRRAIAEQRPAAAVPIGAVQAGSGIQLRIGSTVDGFDQRDLALALSDTRLNQLNKGVVGDLGTGKTQLLKALVHQISSSAASNRGIRRRMLIFDYKRDYSSPDFVSGTGARVVKPHRLPLNLFDTSVMADSMVPWLDRYRFFADVLDKIYSGIGPVQRDKLKRTVRASYDGRPDGQCPTIYDVHAAYAHLLEGKSDSPMAIIDDLVEVDPDRETAGAVF